MRISDWSSDVCSSVFFFGAPHPVFAGRPAAVHRADAAAAVRRAAAGRGLRLRARDRLRPDLDRAGGLRRRRPAARAPPTAAGHVGAHSGATGTPRNHAGRARVRPYAALPHARSHHASTATPAIATTIAARSEAHTTELQSLIRIS